MAQEIENLREGLNSLKAISTGISGLSQIYDFAKQIQSFLFTCIESMNNLPENRDFSTIKTVLGIIDEVLGLYNGAINKISLIENNK